MQGIKMSPCHFGHSVTLMLHKARPRFHPLRSWSSLLPALMLLVLGGCAYAPGLHMKSAQDLRSTSATAPDTTVPDTDAASASDQQLIRITPELIRQLQASPQASAAQQVKHLLGSPKPYAIGPGDVLNIIVWGHPDVNLPPATTVNSDVGGYTVNNEGFVQFPFVGLIKLSGLTEAQARKTLTTQLAKYLKDPQLTLRIQAYRSSRVYLDGEVRTPGLQAINDIPMTLPEALARAGGLTPQADRSAVAVTRQGVTTVVNLERLTAEGINPNRILLVNGDMVRVLSREDAKVFVMGEVLKPSATPLRYGRLSLNEALGENGGVNPTSGDPKQIYVVRSQNGQNPQIFHLDASSPTAYALAEGFALKARDVVYVDPAPLVRWNRVISLILPSAQVVNSGANSLRQ